MNSLAGSEQAIVTDLPGTTRDAIRTTISVNGVPLHLIDTAGLREPQDEVERIGISKALEAVARADMVVWVSDATRPGTRSYDSVVREHLRPGVPELLVVNKIDITGVEPQRRRHAGGEEIWMSAKTGAGLEFLQAALLNAVGWVSTDEGVFMARARHMHAMHSASQHLERASTLGNEIELLAEELKLAQQSLASITGEFTADDLLGRIFSQFCIGK